MANFRKSPALLLAALLGLASFSCGGGTTATAPPPNPGGGGNPPPQVVALNDLGAGNYLGFPGGLYPGGSSFPPAQHNTAGLMFANAVQPLDTSGNPSPAGKAVMLSVGMSNTTQEFCSQSGNLPCDPWTFMGQVAADAAINDTTLVIVNGAQGGKSASFWDSPSDPDYDRVLNNLLTPRGLSEPQVQIAWVKVANPVPTSSLPSSASDAFTLVMQMGNIARALKTRYANLRIIFFSSRIYGGFATTTLNPEPYAYESGLAVKWVVQAQIDQMANAGNVVDQRAGNLNYNTGAPWLAWGPYLWANGTTARSDGLTWVQGDFQADGTHPSQSGEQKVGTLLLNFFKTSPHTKCWFLRAGTCP